MNAEPIRVAAGGGMDRELVIQARGGDHDAFARLAAGSIGRLNAIARLILSDQSRVEDAVQDALVDAWRNLRSLRDPERFDSWLNRILVRSCQDMRRLDRRRRLIELPLADNDSGTGDLQASVAVTDQLERGLRRLTVDQRTVLVLSYYLDLSLADAAATLGIPVGTMKSRLSRAVDALRASIDATERLPGYQAEPLA
jgi:RNA polymerase sigma factor (sigma-70 family)